MIVSAPSKAEQAHIDVSEAIYARSLFGEGAVYCERKEFSAGPAGETVLGKWHVEFADGCTREYLQPTIGAGSQHQLQAAAYELERVRLHAWRILLNDMVEDVEPYTDPATGDWLGWRLLRRGGFVQLVVISAEARP